jgi:hypothetical protein
LSFARVLHDWPADVTRTLLEKACCALAPGGRLVICEELRTRDRLRVRAAEIEHPEVRGGRERVSITRWPE